MTTAPRSIYRNFTFDRATKTRYDRIYVWQQSRGIWRVLVTDDMGDTDYTGPYYRTRAEAMANLEAVNQMWFG